MHVKKRKRDAYEKHIYNWLKDVFLLLSLHMHAYNESK
jgi:hypothetical protein